MAEITTTLRWVDHGSHQSLMAGRVEMAQISKAAASDVWFFTLRFTRDGERQTYSIQGEHAAKTLCESHARTVLS